MDCGIAIESTGQSDNESWHKMWQEANAIYSFCLRKGEAGSSDGLGEQECSC